MLFKVMTLTFLAEAARFQRTLCHQAEIRNIIDLAHAIEENFAAEFEVSTVRRRRRHLLTDIHQNHVKFYSHLSRDLRRVSDELELFTADPFPTVRIGVTEMIELMEQEILKSGAQIKKHHKRDLRKVSLDIYREKVTIHLAYILQSILSVHVQCL